MDSNQFTIKTQEVIQSAQQEAMQAGHQAVENAHLLKGIFNEDKDVVPYILKKMNVNQQNLEMALDRILGTYSRVQGGQIYLSPKAQSTLNTALMQAKKQGDEYVSVEMVLMALLEGSDQTAQLLKDARIDKTTLLNP